MNLDKQFKSFVSKQNLDKKTASIKEFLVQHQVKVKIGLKIADAVKEFAIHKNPFSLVKGAAEVFNDIATDSIESSTRYFSPRNGWKRVYDHSISGALLPGLKNIPHRVINFKYDGLYAKIFTTEFGEFAFCSASRWDADLGGFFSKSSDQNAIKKFIIDENLKYLDGAIISLSAVSNEKNTSYIINKEPIDPKPSKALNEFVAYIKKSFDLGINRSIILKGTPGTGKSCLAQSIVHELKLKTLVYKNSSYENVDAFFFFIKHFGIEAVLLDDFDTVEHSEKLLNTLERLNKEVKLVIGLANSLKDFHPAIIRPRRFDEIKLIETMDEDVVKSALGDLSEKYFKKVQAWPIAYINELVSRSKLYPIEELNEHYKELNGRVKSQLAALKPDGESEE